MSLAGRNAALFVTARMLSLLVPLLALPVLGRVLGPSGVGLLAYAQAFIQYFAVMVDFGFNYVSITTVARCRDDPLELRRVFWSIAVCRLVIYVLCLPPLLALASALGKDAMETQVLQLAVLLLTGVLLTPAWLYQGLERGTVFVVLSLAPRLAALPLIWLLVSDPAHVLRAAWILWGAEFAGGALLFIVAWWKLVPGTIVFNGATARAECRRAFDAWLGALATTAIANVNPLAIREAAGLVAVGYFSAADRIVRVMHSLIYPVVQAYQPQVARLAADDPRSAAHCSLRLTLLLMAVTGMFWLAVQFVGGPIVVLLFGDAFSGAADVLSILGAFPILAAASTAALYFAYYAHDRGRTARPWFPALLLVHLLLLWALVPRYGAAGAAAAVVASEALLAAGLWWRARGWLLPRAAPSGAATHWPELHEPRTSIVICNHNYERFLGRAIESAVSQRRPCQVIVVDDGSTDGSRALLAGWGARVEVVLQPNGGQTAAYNAGFERAHGDIIVFLDSDDFLEPNAADVIAAAFAPDVVKVHYQMRLVDAQGSPLGGTIPHAMSSGKVLPAMRRHGLLYASAPGSGNAYRREALARLFPLPIDPTDRHGADFFTVYGCVAFGEVRAIAQPLASYRVHEPAAAAASMSFGNAASRVDEDALVRRRAQRLRALTFERTGGALRLPGEFLDFSRLKLSFATAVLERPYIAGLRCGIGELPRLARALWLRPEMPALTKGVLSVWAVLVMLAPRVVGVPLARHVCNPSSRRG